MLKNFIFYCFNPHQRVFTNFRERGGGGKRERKKRERERNISVREKHRSVASGKQSNQGLNVQPRYWP